MSNQEDNIKSDGINNSKQDGIVFLQRMKTKGMMGIYCATGVMLVVVVIVLLSRLNEIRNYRVPNYWRRNINRTIRQIREQFYRLKESQDVSNEKIELQRLMTELATLKKISSGADLAQISKIDLESLEMNMDNEMRRVNTVIEEENRERTMKLNVIQQEEMDLNKGHDILKSLTTRSERKKNK